MILWKINNQVFPKTNVYLGNVKLNDTVVRDTTDIYAKYSVGFEEYNGSTYQSCCSGGTYILSSNVIEKILPYIMLNSLSLDKQSFGAVL